MIPIFTTLSWTQLGVLCRNAKRYFLHLLVLILFKPVLYSQSGGYIKLDNTFSIEKNVLNRNTTWVLKDEHHRDIYQAIHDSALFEKPNKFHDDNKGGNNPYWLRFTVITSADCQNHVMDIHSPNVKKVEVFKLSKEGNVVFCGATGIDIPLEKRPFHYKNLMIDLKIEAGKTTEYYVRISPGAYCRFNLHLTPYDFILYFGSTEYLCLGIFYGMLLVLVIYKLIIFISLKDKAFIAYILLLISAAIKTLSEDRLGALYIWSDYPQISYWLGVHIGPWLVLITFVYFVHSFLEIKPFKSTPSKWVFYSIGLYSVFYIVSFFIFGDTLYFNSLFILPYLSLCLLTCIYYKRKKITSIYFLAGNFLFLLIILIDILRHQRLLFGGIFIVFSFYIFMVVQSIILALSIMDRLKMLARQKEELLKKQFESEKALLGNYLKEQKNRSFANDLKTFVNLINGSIANLQLMDTDLSQMTSKVERYADQILLQNNEHESTEHDWGIEGDMIEFLHGLSLTLLNKRVNSSLVKFDSNLSHFICRFKPNLLEQILFPILFKAVKENEDMETVKIKVWVDNESNRLQITVEDKGSGSDFEKLSEWHETEFGKSLKLVSNLGGNVEIFSERNKGTIVQLSLPLFTVCQSSLDEQSIVKKNNSSFSTSTKQVFKNNKSKSQVEFEQKVNHFLECNLDNEELTIDYMAKELGTSRAQLYRKFTETYGVSVKEFITAKRIEMAAKLISSGDYNIKETMSKVGFNNRNYFIKCFKEKYEVLPSEYKKKEQAN